MSWKLLLPPGNVYQHCSLVPGCVLVLSGSFRKILIFFSDILNQWVCDVAEAPDFKSFPPQVFMDQPCLHCLETLEVLKIKSHLDLQRIRIFILIRYHLNRRHIKDGKSKKTLSQSFVKEPAFESCEISILLL